MEIQKLQPLFSVEPPQLQGSLRRVSRGLGSAEASVATASVSAPSPALLSNSLRGVASENISKINLPHTTKSLFRAYFQELKTIKVTSLF